MHATLSRNLLARTAALLAITALASGLAACDSMSRHDTNTATGAVLGGAAGAILTGGSTAGTVGGAVIGGVIGDRVDPKDKK